MKSNKNCWKLSFFWDFLSYADFLLLLIIAEFYRTNWLSLDQPRSLEIGRGFFVCLNDKMMYFIQWIIIMSPYECRTF